MKSWRHLVLADHIGYATLSDLVWLLPVAHGPWWKRSMLAGMGRKLVKLGSLFDRGDCADDLCDIVQLKRPCHDLVTRIFDPAPLHIHPMTIPSSVLAQY
jgi:hypothetical protein